MSSLHLDALHWSPDASTELLRGVHLEEIGRAHV